MPVVLLKDVPKQPFAGGATYQTIVGDDDGSTPVRCGVQISPPGYATGVHSHPYLEVVSVLEGVGEAWMEGMDGFAPVGPGTTLVLTPGLKHCFRATGPGDLKTYGVHASPDRIVDFFPEED
ncbi:MAG: cupin domain-containing protein [Alphaproteobacteria bacterium]|jgi:mannose-6-phosphate isomerase-like protein (cupin superfamily)|nr:cupin domain-containing protein [Alphaproteobacteria bacterium]MDP6815437.1 cupin domain-containing protein [Alphaproteobacteria bacterium]|tara:strand:- start:138 stop:503 length:366 start_codon:yes stop_codon:yes gene_type:complete